MSALTLVMKEVDMDAEEFVNVRAYHSRGGGPPTSQGDDSSSPTGNDECSGLGSLTGEEKPGASSTKATKKAGPWKDLKSLLAAKEDKQTLPKKELIDKIMYGGRNVLNLERNLQPHQWQLSSPLKNALDFNKIARSIIHFFQLTEALVEQTVTCRICDFGDPFFPQLHREKLDPRAQPNFWNYNWILDEPGNGKLGFHDTPAKLPIFHPDDDSRT